MEKIGVVLRKGETKAEPPKRKQAPVEDVFWSWNGDDGTKENARSQRPGVFKEAFAKQA
jgi:hypothetical protein